MCMYAQQLNCTVGEDELSEGDSDSEIGLDYLTKEIESVCIEFFIIE